MGSAYPDTFNKGPQQTTEEAKQLLLVVVEGELSTAAKQQHSSVSQPPQHLVEELSSERETESQVRPPPVQ